jgi:hypothetical protein
VRTPCSWVVCLSSARAKAWSDVDHVGFRRQRQWLQRTDAVSVAGALNEHAVGSANRVWRHAPRANQGCAGDVPSDEQAAEAVEGLILGNESASCHQNVTTGRVANNEAAGQTVSGTPSA